MQKLCYSVVMSTKIEEKSLGAFMASSVVDAFTEQVDNRGQKKKRSLEAAVRLWVALPQDLQAEFLSQETDAETWQSLVKAIVNQQLQAQLETLTPGQKGQVARDIKATKRKIGRK